MTCRVAAGNWAILRRLPGVAQTRCSQAQLGPTQTLRIARHPSAEWGEAVVTQLRGDRSAFDP